MLQTLSNIPDHHFSHIRSLCLDFGWHTSGGLHTFGGFLHHKVDQSMSDSEDQSLSDSDDQFNDPFYVVVDEPPPFDGIKRLLDAVLRKGSEKLVVKLLWTTSVSIPVQRETVWVEEEEHWGCGEFMSHVEGFRSFREWFRTWGYNEDRVRLISRLQWKDERPDELNWEGVEMEKYWDC
jgi:hypothetical protein